MEVVNAFNTWAFKREQPHNTERMYEVVNGAVSAQEPLQFVLYWGKGPRRMLGEAERTCLAYLQSMGDRIKQVHAPGAQFDLLLTDTHALLNGHRSTDVTAYFDAVTTSAEAAGMSAQLLSHVVNQSAVTAASIARVAMPEELIAMAAKWYRGPLDAEAGARAYFDMNMIERAAVSRLFPNAIFVTFNGSDLLSLFPDQMPIFFMYSLRKGCAVKPWFMDLAGRAPLSLGDQRH
jgi:L-tyrosine isonitrile synthase